MRIVIAPDSFKESITAAGAAEAIKRGILDAYPEADVISVPMADGGEGTVEAFISAIGGEIRIVKAKDPLGNEIDAFFGVLNDKTCVIEVAGASGLVLVPERLRNPLKTSSYGTGELIIQALDTNCKRLIIGLGGSATCDGGIGMLSALGVRFYGNNMIPVTVNGSGLEKIQHIDVSAIDKRLKDVEILVMCDVTNPLYGNSGAAYVFAPQKGADEKMVKRLDKGLINYSRKIFEFLGKDISNLSGGGAAGGLGAAFCAFLNASLDSGLNVMQDITRLEDKIANCDLVITGEGKTDYQTLFGKVPLGIASIAKKYNVPCVCISGALDGDLTELYHKGVTALFSICNSPMSLEYAKNNAAYLLANQAKSVIRLFMS